MKRLLFWRRVETGGYAKIAELVGPLLGGVVSGRRCVTATCFVAGLTLTLTYLLSRSARKAIQSISGENHEKVSGDTAALLEVLDYLRRDSSASAKSAGTGSSLN